MVEKELAAALERLEMEDSTTDQLKKAHLTLRRSMQKAMSNVR
jgi:L1 cell adhesion molecule like protein